MDFSLTEEQQQLRRTVRDFAKGEIAPHVMEWDEASQFPSELIPKLAEMGFLGVLFPEKYGGAGLGYIEYVLVIEELSRVDGSIGIIVAAHNSLCTNHVYKFGSEEQKQKYVAPLAQGKKLGCWSLTEPEAGSDAGGARTVAVKKDSGWVINGSKTFITNGHYADVCVCMALTDQSKKTHGFSAFIVEKGTEGFRPGKKRKQARTARERHERNNFHGLPRAGGKSSWQGRRGVRQYVAGAGRRANLDRGNGPGHGAGRL